MSVSVVPSTRTHWWLKVALAMPSGSAMSPGPAVSVWPTCGVWPTCAVPAIAGAPVAAWLIVPDSASDTVVAEDQSMPVAGQLYLLSLLTRLGWLTLTLARSNVSPQTCSRSIFRSVSGRDLSSITTSAGIGEGAIARTTAVMA